MKVCPSCEGICMGNDVFCPNDGIRLIDLRCRYCGNDVGPKNNFCRKCGRQIQQDIQERLRRYEQPNSD